MNPLYHGKSRFSQIAIPLKISQTQPQISSIKLNPSSSSHLLRIHSEKRLTEFCVLSQVANLFPSLNHFPNPVGYNSFSLYFLVICETQWIMSLYLFIYHSTFPNWVLILVESPFFNSHLTQSALFPFNVMVR